MASLDLIRRHLYAAAAVAGLLLGGIVGLFFPIRAASPPKPGSEAWSLPAIADTKRFSEDASLSLRTAGFWKTVAAPGQGSTSKTAWTLNAIITRPGPMAAVSQTGGKQPPAMVAVGARLPDGSTLLRMTRDSIWFEKDGCLRERRLFRAVTTENNACLGDAKPTTADPDASKTSETPPPAAAPRQSGVTPAPPAKPAPQAAAATP